MSDDNYFADLIAAETSKLDARLKDRGAARGAGHPSNVVADNENKAKSPQ
jgi:hypothetical protein